MEPIIKRGRRVVPLDQKATVEHRLPPSASGMAVGATGLAIPKAEAAQGTLFRFPPLFAPPPGALDFQTSGTSSIAGPSTAIVAGSTFTIPRNSIGYIRSIQFDINDVVATTLVTFSLLFNEAPVPGWNNIRVFPRVAASVSISYGPEETFIRVPDGQTISLRVTVTDANTYVVGALYHGWHFSKSIARDYGLAGT